MVTTTSRSRRPNADTLARWDAALDRAVAKGIRILQHAVTGDFYATGSDGLTVYRLRYFTCECAAAEGGDPVCLHRAAFREHCRQDDRRVAHQLAGQADPSLDGYDIDALLAEPAIPITFAEIEAMIDGTMARPAPATSPDRMCTSCLDTGWARMATGYGLNDYTEVPYGCGAQAPAVAA